MRQFQIKIVAAAYLLAALFLTSTASAQHSAAWKILGKDPPSWSSHYGFSRRLSHAADYSNDVRSYLEQNTKPSPAVAKEMADELGKNLESAKEHLAAMKNDAGEDKATLAAIDRIEKHLDAAFAHHKDLRECCNVEDFSTVKTMACCKDLSKEIDAVVAEHNALMKSIAQKMTAHKPAAGEGNHSTKATFLVTGLHCPPCTKTVEGSLAKTKGVKSVSVDWRTKNAKIEFDEAVLPAQALAQKIAGTPHMMGGGMRYGGWLALKVPSVKDDASGKAVKEALANVEGISQVAPYPAQHSVGIAFSGKGQITSQEVIDLLAKAGIEASN